MAETEQVCYEYLFADGSRQRFCFELRMPSLELVVQDHQAMPEWTALAYRQCPNCPMEESESSRCPAAAALVPASDAFGDRVSYEQVEVVIGTPHRTYQKVCTLQEAVCSLMGLLMATCGCPVMDKLRPMAFVHLPFSTMEQTTYRAVSMYLLAQYFRKRRGMEPDWELKSLARTYEEIRKVNMAFADRLRSIQGKDANLNAIAQLDNHADMAEFSIKSEWWEEIEGAFYAYLDEPLFAAH